MSNQYLTPSYCYKFLVNNTFKRSLDNTPAKFKTTNNVFHKLSGTTWWFSDDTWIGLINRRILRPGMITLSYWLPFLYITTADLRRKNALLWEYRKLNNNPQLPIHCDMQGVERSRLWSRHPTTVPPKNWTESQSQSQRILAGAVARSVPWALSESYRATTCQWVSSSIVAILQQITGRCADSLHKWSITLTDTSNCDGDRQTIMSYAIIRWKLFGLLDDNRHHKGLHLSPRCLSVFVL